MSPLVWQQVESDRPLHCLVVANDGSNWATTPNDQILFRETATSPWVVLDGACVTVRVSSGGNVFCLNRTGNLYYREGISYSCPQGNHWAPITGSPTLLDFGVANGVLWVIDTAQRILFREGITMENPKGTQYRIQYG